MSDAPRLEWRVLNEGTQIAVRDGRVVVILYAVRSGVTDKEEIFEFSSIPVDEPDAVETHGAVGSGTSLWDTRWELAHRWAERELA